MKLAIAALILSAAETLVFFLTIGYVPVWAICLFAAALAAPQADQLCRRARS
jgi:hypothetical protein